MDTNSTAKDAKYAKGFGTPDGMAGKLVAGRWGVEQQRNKGTKGRHELTRIFTNLAGGNAEMTESLRDRMMGKAVSKSFRREDVTKAGNCRKERREHKDFILCGLSVLCVRLSAA